jgi:hypothetical protein
MQGAVQEVRGFGVGAVHNGCDTATAMFELEVRAGYVVSV